MTLPADRKQAKRRNDVERAIRALDAAWKAMEPVEEVDPESLGASMLRSSILAYVEYLKEATWWR